MLWSDDLVARKRSRDNARYWQWRNEYDREVMTAGPHLAQDGCTLIVPSNRYNKQAAGFWSSKGFRFDRDHTRWTRDTRRPLGGKRYPASAWLERTRAMFYQFYPEYLPPDPPAQTSQNVV